MFDWWNELSTAGQVFTIIAIPATVVMIIQSILLLIGIGVDSDIDSDGLDDADSGGDGLSLISVRGVVAFFSIGGWTGLVCDNAGLPVIISSIIAFAAGLCALIFVALIFKAAMKLQGSGNTNLSNAIGKTGTVYIPVPPMRTGHGKINILLQGRMTELDAVSDDDETAKTGEEVFVTGIADEDTIVIKRTNKTKAKESGGISKWVQEQ